MSNSVFLYQFLEVLIELEGVSVVWIIFGIEQFAVCDDALEVVYKLRHRLLLVPIELVLYL